MFSFSSLIDLEAEPKANHITKSKPKLSLGSALRRELQVLLTTMWYNRKKLE